MADIGSLVVKVTADSQGLTRGLEAARGAVKVAGEKITSTFSRVALAAPLTKLAGAAKSIGQADVWGPLAAGAAGATAAVTALAVAYSSGVSRITETIDAARAAGVAIGDYQAVLESTGGSAASAASAIEKLRGQILLSGTAFAKSVAPLTDTMGTVEAASGRARASVEALASVRLPAILSGVADRAAGDRERLQGVLSNLGAGVAPIKLPAIELPSTVAEGAEQIRSQAEALAQSVEGVYRAVRSRIESTFRGIAGGATPATEAIDSTTDALGRLGLRGRDLAGLPLPQAIARIADRFATLKSPADQARIAYELFGDGARDLVPTLLEGGKGIESAAEAVRRSGRAVSEADAINARAAQRTIERLSKLKDAATTQLAAGIAPVLAEIGSLFDGVGDKVGGLAETTVSTAEILGYAGAAAAETWKGLTLVWDVLKITFKEMVALTLEGIARVGDAVNAASEKIKQLSGVDLGKLDVSGLRESATSWTDSASQDMTAFWKGWLNDRSAFRQTEEFFDRVRDRIKQVHADAKKASVIDAILADQARIDKLRDRLRGPLDEFRDSLKEVLDLQARGAFRLAPGLDVQTLGAEFRKLQQSFQMPEVKFAGAAERNTREAYTAILKFQNPQKAEGVQEAMRRIQEQLLREQKENVRVGKDVLKVLKNNPPLQVKGI